MADTDLHDEHIYHLTTRAQWEAARAEGTFRGSTRGLSLEDVGFIHASRRDQLSDVAQAVYRDCDEALVVLAVSVAALKAEGITVRLEDGGNATKYPHIYAPLPCRLVEDVHDASFDERGRFVSAI